MSDGPPVTGEGTPPGPAVSAAPRTPAARERRALTESMVAALIIAAAALTWGIVSGARIVVFDGVYMLLGLVLSWMSLRVSSTVEAGPTARFPFGREALVPLAIAIQGLALLGTLVYAAADAVVIIRDGGSDVAPLAVAGYGAATAVLSYLLAARLLRVAGGSELIVAEAAQWRAGAWLSVVMAIGAGVAIALPGSRLDALVPYVDPILVLLACALLVRVPLTLLRSGFTELLEGAAPPAVQDAVHASVSRVRATFGLGEPVVRLSKVGRKLYVEVDFMVEAGQWDIADEDRVRRAMLTELEPLGYDLWAAVELTTDAALMA